MDTLITKLKEEHKQLLETLDKINQLGVSSPQGMVLLFSIKNALLDHLEKEDLLLYPVLQAAAEHHPKLKDTLNLFAKDMEKITETATVFFNTYENGSSGVKFATDFGTMLGTLRVRIRREESILYAEYEKINVET